MIEIGKEYIYNNELDNDLSMEEHNNKACKVVSSSNKDLFNISFFNDDYIYTVYETSLVPISETTYANSKYKRAWKALPERLGGKIKVSTLVIILKIMDEVISDE